RFAMASLRERNGWFQILFRYGVDVADYLLKGGKVPEPPAPVEKALTLKDLAERYEAAHQNRAVEKNTLATARMHLRHFIHSLGERYVLRTLTAHDLHCYLDNRAPQTGP